MNSMKGINAYFQQLSAEEIGTKAHRECVGGLWDVLGKLQLDYLIGAGLNPGDRLLDIGCGCLRGGIPFINYLDEGKYFGIDINASLIEAGWIEVEEAGLMNKKPALAVDDFFGFETFGVKFDFMIAVSVFTHLPRDLIVLCLENVRKNLQPHGTCYATFFQSPFSAHRERIRHEPGGIVTCHDADPFHYSIDELATMAKVAELELDVIGDWQHPRNQMMAAFRRLG